MEGCVFCFCPPERLFSVSKERVIDISCGSKHSAAVTQGGQVFCWGDSTEGQCGLVQLLKYPSPECVEIIQTVAATCEHTVAKQVPVFVEQVDCGAHHTVALSADGEVWTWGSGVQLGLNNIDKAPVPMKVEFLVGRKVLSVCCATNHTLALVRKDKVHLNNGPGQRKATPKLSLKSSRKRPSSGDKSRSQSPIINNVQQHRLRPATCIKCENEIYSYAENEDSVVINDTHMCPLGLEVNGKQPELASNSEADGLLALSQNTSSATSKNPPNQATSEGATLLSGIATSQDMQGCSETETGKELGASGVSSSEITVDFPETDSTQKITAQPPSQSDVNDSNSGTVLNKDETESISHPQAACISVQQRIVYRRSHSAAVSELHIDTSSPDHMLDPSGQDHMDSSQLYRSQSFSPRSGIRKSRSAFLDETEAKHFLEKQLCGEDEKPSVSRQNSGSSPPNSPFVKKIQENILNYMPTAPAMQEYVSNFTKNMVSNIKTSMDKFGFPQNVEEESDEQEQDLLRQRMGSVDEEEVGISYEQVLSHFKNFGHDFSIAYLCPSCMYSAGTEIHVSVCPRQLKICADNLNICADNLNV